MKNVNSNYFRQGRKNFNIEVSLQYVRDLDFKKEDEFKGDTTGIAKGDAGMYFCLKGFDQKSYEGVVRFGGIANAVKCEKAQVFCCCSIFSSLFVFVGSCDRISSTNHES